MICFLSYIYYYLEALVYIIVFFFMPALNIGENEIEQEFDEYLTHFHKAYPDKNEYAVRMKAFEKSLIMVEYLNRHRTKHSAIYGLTKYSDMHSQEFLNSHLLPVLAKRIPSLKQICHKHHSHKRIKPHFNLPQRVDWRDKNVVTEVKSQKKCGGCWAFTAIETVESMYAIRTNELTKLSVQQLIDCAENNNGCNGGDICSAVDWIKSHNMTVVADEDYPLEFEKDECQDLSTEGVTGVANYSCDSFVESEEKLLHLLATVGPVSVAVDAQSWQHYQGGIIQYHCPGNPLKINHAAQVVGYDLTHEVPHYIVRNSWGTDFGDDGYLYVEFGKNLCGIPFQVTSVTIE